MGGDAFTEKAFISALFFGCSKSRKLVSIVKGKATGRCPHDVLISTFFVRCIDEKERIVICIIAWALRVARLTIGAMRDALSSGTSNRYSTRAFL